MLEEDIALYYAVKNALDYREARVQSVLGKLYSDDRFRAKGKEAFSIAERSVTRVNKLSKGDLEKLLADLSEIGREEKKEEKKGLEQLDINGKVITRFPPEPNGYLHIGHAKAAIIDHEYAREYNGKFQLRFDDTNPRNERAEFYEAQKKDLRWLGLCWEEEFCSSQDMDLFYQYCEELLKKGSAFVCACKGEKVKALRKERKPCLCRPLSPEENMERWKKMFSSKEGEAVVRLRGDLTSENSVMWDPTLFRIIDHEHPIQGGKYRVWPTYDFAGAIEDSVHGVTHALRSKEYELRDELYFKILDLLALRKPRLIEFSRLELEGTELSKRVITRRVKEKGWSWDDPRLATLRGLRRRGITSQAIRELVLSLGVSKSEATVSWEILFSLNRKVVDPIARRFFFVEDPVRLTVENGPVGVVKLKNHPSMDLGFREIHHDGEFFIPAREAARLKEGEIVRLKDLYNFRVEEKSDGIRASYSESQLDRKTKKIEWVSRDHVNVEVLRAEGDELNVLKGYGEKGIERLKAGEIVQLERFGFCRVDGPCRLIFSHR